MQQPAASLRDKQDFNCFRVIARVLRAIVLEAWPASLKRNPRVDFQEVKLTADGANLNPCR